MKCISNLICKFVTKTYCRCRNLNCRTVEYNYREKLLVASKYCLTVNCRTIEMSDCEIRLYPNFTESEIGLCILT